MIEKEQPIEAKMRRIMNDIGTIIGREIHRIDADYGFALLVFSCDDVGHGREGRMNYISNANREDMLAAMKEFIARNEGRYGGDFTKKRPV